MATVPVNARLLRFRFDFPQHLQSKLKFAIGNRVWISYEQDGKQHRTRATVHGFLLEGERIIVVTDESGVYQEDVTLQLPG